MKNNLILFIIYETLTPSLKFLHIDIRINEITKSSQSLVLQINNCRKFLHFAKFANQYPCRKFKLSTFKLENLSHIYLAYYIHTCLLFTHTLTHTHTQTHTHRQTSCVCVHGGLLSVKSTQIFCGGV